MILTHLRPLAVFALALPAAADVLQLEPVLDNTLYEEPTGATSNGVGPRLFAGLNSQGLRRRAVLAFDIASAVPAGSQIKAVSLTLNMSQSNSGGFDFSLHRLQAAWGEGTSNAGMSGGGGAPSTPGDATWIHTFFPDATWAQPGGDFVPQASATTNVAGVGSYVWSSPALVSDVQAMLDQPGADFGWILKAAVEMGNNSKRFDSRQNGNNRPLLEVTFDPPCQAQSFCSTSPNSVGNGALIGFTGTCDIAAEDLTLTAGPVPNEMGIFFYSAGQLNGGAGLPFGNGLRCVGGGAGLGVFRLPMQLAAGNELSFDFEFDLPQAGPITPGSTWNFQAWYRDPAAGGAGFNLSDALSLTFQ